MTEEEYQRVLPIIEMAQTLHRKLYGKLVDKGVAPIDVAIAGVYAVHNLASVVVGSHSGAIEWMRNFLDVIERRVLEQAKPN